jgi:hypothetical protein
MAAGKVSSLTAHRALDHNRLRVILCCKNWATFSDSILIACITDYSVARPRRSHHARMTGSHLDSAISAYKTDMNQIMLLFSLYLKTK